MFHKLYNLIVIMKSFEFLWGRIFCKPIDLVKERKINSIIKPIFYLNTIVKI